MRCAAAHTLSKSVAAKGSSELARMIASARCVGRSSRAARLERAAAASGGLRMRLVEETVSGNSERIRRGERRGEERREERGENRGERRGEERGEERRGERDSLAADGSVAGGTV